MPLNHVGAGGLSQALEQRHRAGELGPVGNVIKFPEEGHIVRFGRADIPEQSATVIILPVIRVERHADPHMEDGEPRTRPPADNGGRRRVRRR